MTNQQLPPDTPETSDPSSGDDGHTAENLGRGGKSSALLLSPALIVVVVALIIIIYFIVR